MSYPGVISGINLSGAKIIEYSTLDMKFQWIDNFAKIPMLNFCFQGLFMKDSNTLAFYNFMNSGVVQLQLKERGGRKK